MTLGELFTGLGYLTGAVVWYWAARSQKRATEGMLLVAAVGFTAAIVGAKLTQALASGTPSAVLNPSSGGRSLLGGVLFGWAGVELAKRKLGIRSSTGDLFALALPAGEAVGRIGCFFNGCCYGTECQLPWSVWQHDALRHPAQLYSAGISALLFFALLWAKPRLKVEGELFRWYLFGFGLTRFALEFIRWRESLVFGLSPMQWFCLELSVYSSIWLWRKRRSPNYA